MVDHIYFIGLDECDELQYVQAKEWCLDTFGCENTTEQTGRWSVKRSIWGGGIFTTFAFGNEEDAMAFKLGWS